MAISNAGIQRSNKNLLFIYANMAAMTSSENVTIFIGLFACECMLPVTRAYTRKNTQHGCGRLTGLNNVELASMNKVIELA